MMTDSRKLVWLAIPLVAVALILALYAGWRIRATLRPEHLPVRKIAILSQARQGSFETVVLGDSMVELADLGGICGPRVLNAGIGGARAHDLVEFAPALMAASKPRRLIVVVGVNDAAIRHKTDIAEFDRDLTSIASLAASKGAAVTFATLAPINSSLPAGATIDADRLVRLNELIEKRPSVLRLSGQFPRELPTDMTIDGVHLNRSGYDRWKPLLQTACREAH